MSSQRWYLAVLVVASDIQGTPDADSAALDLQYRLIRAGDHEEAYTRALEFGEGEAHSYLNSDGLTVAWRCLGLHDLQELDVAELADGTEVYSRIVRGSAQKYVVRKEHLSCFWNARNKDRTAADILGE